MKRILVIACALFVSPGAFAQIYKWVDKDGRISYSDQPPPAQQSKKFNVGTGQPAPPERSARERDKDLEKGRIEANEKAKTAAESDKKAKLAEENCNRAKSNLRTVTDGGRIATFDAKGERVYMDDAQLEQERVKARQVVDDFCKGS